MTTTSCPNCGKPIRPGAKFCGICGSTLSSGGQSRCPHCDKPVREGAKFCSHCGQTIDAAVIQPTEPQATTPAEVQPMPDASVEVSTAPAIAQGPPEGAQPAPVIAQPAPEPARRRYKYLPWLILILIIVCAAAVVAGLWIFNPGDIFSKATETPTATLAPTETTAPATEELAPAPTFTPTIPLPTETEPAAPTETPTPEVITPTVTLPPPGGNVILEEDFNTTLAQNWRVWGKPRPIIERGFGDNYLSLTATNPGNAGVSSKAEFFLEPGLEMSFGAQLQPGYSQYILVFSWDPLQHVRDTGNNEPGVIQLEISREKAVIRSALNNERCEAPVQGAEAHDYLIRILGEFSVALYIDDDTQSACALTNIGMEAPIVGRITYRDMGLVSSVLVTGP